MDGRRSVFYRHVNAPATANQLECLAELGVRATPGLSYREADRLIKENRERWARLPPTEAQRHFLQYRAWWREGMTRGEATDLIARIKAGRDELVGFPPPGMRDGDGDAGGWPPSAAPQGNA
jgi:hypothetical protein